MSFVTLIASAMRANPSRLPYFPVPFFYDAYQPVAPLVVADTAFPVPCCFLRLVFCSVFFFSLFYDDGIVFLRNTFCLNTVLLFLIFFLFTTPSVCFREARNSSVGHDSPGRPLPSFFVGVVIPELNRRRCGYVRKRIKQD